MKVVNEISSAKLVSPLFWDKSGKVCSVKDEDGNRVIFTEFPDYVTPKLKKMKFLVGYSGKELKWINPYSGMFKAKFVAFASEEDKDPEPRKTDRSWKGETWTDYTMMAIFRLTSPAVMGVQTAMFLTYGQSSRDFVVEVDGEAGIHVGKSGKAKMLVDFLNALGVLEKSVKYSDNLLPVWEKLIKKAGKEVNLIYQDGNISAILPVDEYDESDDFEEDEPEDEVIEEDGDDELTVFDDEDVPF